MVINQWDDFAAGWDSNDDVQTYAKKAFESWTETVSPLVSDLSSARILDFGCGTGLLTERFAPLCDQILAVDTSSRMIDVLQRKKMESGADNIVALQIDVNAATINERPEFTGKFDLVLASSVCSFLPDYETTLRDLVSVIAAGGHLVQWDWLADMPVARIEAAFNVSGLTICGIDEAFSLDADGQSMPVVMGLGRKPN